MVDISIPELPDYNKGPTSVYQTIMQLGADPFNKVNDKSRRYAEFIKLTWNYPGYFEHYYSHLKYRLTEIHKKYGGMADYYDKRYKQGHLVKHVSSEIINETYWDFEDYLTTMSTSLDILTIICRPAYKQVPPPTFSQFSEWNIPKGEDSNGIHKIFKNARDEWAEKMKAYRVQVVHYTPLNKDATLVSLKEYGSRFELHVRIPDPESIPEKDSLNGETWQFTYSENIDLLIYSIDIFNKLTKLEQTLASELFKLYQNGEYPRKERSIK